MPKTKTIALISLDQVLFIQKQGFPGSYSGDAWINFALLESLRKAGIRDVYLVTVFSAEMSRDIGSLFHRDRYGSIGFYAGYQSIEEIVRTLQREQFNVHGVLSPQDVVYARGLGAAYQDIYLPQFQRVQDGKITMGTIRTDPEFLAACRSLCSLSGNFHEKLKTLNHQRGFPDTAYKYCLGFLYEYFLTNCPFFQAENASVLFFSRDEDDVKDVSMAYKNLMRREPAALVSVKQPLLTCVEVYSRLLAQTFFDPKIKLHLDKLKIREKIVSRIAARDWSLFVSISDADKKAALGVLLEELYKNPNAKVSDIISCWLENPSSLTVSSVQSVVEGEVAAMGLLDDVEVEMAVLLPEAERLSETERLLEAEREGEIEQSPLLLSEAVPKTFEEVIAAPRGIFQLFASTRTQRFIADLQAECNRLNI